MSKAIFVNDSKQVDVDEIIELKKNQKMDYVQFAKHFNITQNQFKIVMKDFKLDYPEEYKIFLSLSRVRNKKFIEEKFIEILRKQYKSESEIAKEFNMSPNSVRVCVARMKKNHPVLYEEYLVLQEENRKKKERLTKNEIIKNKFLKESMEAQNTNKLSVEEAIRILRECAAELDNME